MERSKKKSIIEGILFTSGDSVSVDSIGKALGLPKDETEELIKELAQEYEENDRGIRIQKINDNYQMSSSKDIYEYLVKIARQPKKYVLSDVLLETLSIIAYKQPVTKAEIEKIRGVSSDHAVNRLVQFDLVKELGRMDAPGRPMLFGTTENFLRTFGLSSMDDLPRLDPAEVEEWKIQAEEEAYETISDENIEGEKSSNDEKA